MQEGSLRAGHTRQTAAAQGNKRVLLHEEKQNHHTSYHTGDATTPKRLNASLMLMRNRWAPRLGFFVAY